MTSAAAAVTAIPDAVFEAALYLHASQLITIAMLGIPKKFSHLQASSLRRAGLYSRRLSSRASAILSSLDLLDTRNEIPGVFDGEWKGSGDVLESVCPSTREILARVRAVSDYYSV